MADTRSDLFSIGEFSRVSKMSVKTLRFYDERGLLKPGHIDARSGYRYYSSAQLNEANLIRLLRSLELPLEDIQVFLRAPSPTGPGPGRPPRCSRSRSMSRKTRSFLDLSGGCRVSGSAADARHSRGKSHLSVAVRRTRKRALTLPQGEVRCSG